MQLQVTDEDQGLLQELLDDLYRDLSYEIAATDNRRFREQLRLRRESVRKLLDALGGPLPDRPSIKA